MFTAALGWPKFRAGDRALREAQFLVTTEPTGVAVTRNRIALAISEALRKCSVAEQNAEVLLPVLPDQLRREVHFVSLFRSRSA